jgi:hypothetical protein
MVRRAIAAAALAATLAAPASAVGWLTFDEAQALHALSQIEQYKQMIASAQTELKSLPANLFSATDASQRLVAVQGLLQAAQQACTNPASAALPVCQVRENVAKQQASTLARDIADMQSLRNAASGSQGNLSIAQTNAAALLKIAQKLQDAEGRDLANEQGSTIDQKARLQVSPSKTGNPW